MTTLTEERKKYSRRTERTIPATLDLSGPQIDRINESRVVSLITEMYALHLSNRQKYTPLDVDDCWVVEMARNRGFVQGVNDSNSYKLTKRGEARAASIISYFEFMMGFRS
ncbi:hypothetical protein CO038_04390 [Candidatus Pacearchaeota archaeon CG_4_9_14_0_2_um_filter_39_13]|nr:hypothetical protein [Candidatus Pacearchaeota archaeon]PJC44307.1 MAG: hypothetical protein CO038_04390 [Candidatus Pacearchaeota archaeon CG_4_9_14_0_2_um_filter_39_13]